MARGNANGSSNGHASEFSSLPKVSFTKIDDDVSTQPCGVHDGQARAFGYNDFSEFHRPDSYIRHIEPLESELAKQVEYDMDEQDKEWLDVLNRERRKEQMSPISYELFEVVMDRLEKEWFDLTKNITKPDLAMPSEDSTCAICDDAEGENSNAIVFCDGCNLAVHQDCYGVPYIPEGQWLCRKCTVSPENPVSCMLCPNEGGAFKQTTHGDWVHLLCAIWVPETRVANEVFMEPVVGVDKISKQRWKLKCYVCEVREGACIQCAKTSCFLAFHATCARKEQLLLPMKGAHGSEPLSLTCYCDRHLPKEQQDIRAAALAAEEEEDGAHQQSAKSARAYAKTYKPGPPLVPAIVVNRIDYYIRRFKLTKRIPTLQLMCRYWSLKREARRGAPLLKRLHLEPWTAAGAGGRVMSEEEKLMKLDQLNHLLYDMEGLRDLTFSVKKREKWKLEQARAVYDVLESSLFAHSAPLRAAFDKISGLDRQEYFKNPVSKVQVPDYFDVVKKPMCWTVIEGKLDRHEYWDLQDFKDDIGLVIDNAILYNKSGTPFQKTALRIQAAAVPILEELRNITVNTHTDQISGEDGQMPLVGDLEPSLDLLELLLSTDAIQPDIDLVLSDMPLASLFSFELPKAKPPPPPPTPPPPPPPKFKRDRKAEAAKRKMKKEAAAAAAAQEEKENRKAVKKPRTTRAMATAVAEGDGETMADVEAPVAEGTAATADTAEYTTATIEDSTVEAPPFRESTEEAYTQPLVEGTLEASAKRGRRRAPAPMAAAPTDMLPLVDSVDSQQSFKMFNMGWILPPGERRRGRAPPVERPPTPRPKKKARTDAGPSRLSVVSTVASDVEEPASLQPEPSINEGSAPMEVDRTPPETPLYPPPLSSTRLRRPPPSSSAANRDDQPPVQVVHENGIVFLEKLDTPAIRREKFQRKREEQKKRLTELTAASTSSVVDPGATLPLSLAPSAVASTSVSAVAGPSRAGRKKKDDDKKGTDSELSSLSDAGGEAALTAPGPAKKKGGRGRQAAPAAVEVDDSLGRVVLEDGKMIEGGTLVWAKADTYPWWPAVIYEDNDPLIPPNVLLGCLDSRLKPKNAKIPIHILQFFDKQKSWQFLALDKLKMLGEIKTLDDDLLAEKSSRQKWKNQGMQKACRESYQVALAEMETKSDLAENEREEHIEGLAEE
ncbi:hypothetical protein DXG03_009352 [Asterophora parasitica]|uniref:Peregrin n=1 Tax=Asterophora parasitica TaxID=117018 RepID=A0A9P7G6Z0_9AGAR|nr:hypothetical protein DXG03_009352 [Asterophora parasitica]